MGEGFQLLDIVLLAMVAAFVVLRLRSVLGRRTGHERPPPRLEGRERTDGDGNVVQLPSRGDPAVEPEIAGGPASAGLTRIQLADPSFEPAQFLQGARAAYEMIVTAFAAGDTSTLEPLLNEEVFRNFSAAIEERKRAGHTLETTLVAIKQAEIVEAELRGTMAEVTIRFVSELINATRDGEGNLVAGNPNAVDEVTDIWTFSRDTQSQDPNWFLIGTSVPS